MTVTLSAAEAALHVVGMFACFAIMWWQSKRYWKNMRELAEIKERNFQLAQAVNDMYVKSKLMMATVEHSHALARSHIMEAHNQINEAVERGAKIGFDRGWSLPRRREENTGARSMTLKKVAVWKFAIGHASPGENFIISMPARAAILCVQTQENIPCIWAAVDPDCKEKDERMFVILGTGFPYLTDTVLFHVGTFQQQAGRLVWHLFEIARRSPALETKPEARA